MTDEFFTHTMLGCETNTVKAVQAEPVDAPAADETKPAAYTEPKRVKKKTAKKKRAKKKAAKKKTPKPSIKDTLKDLRDKSTDDS